MVARVHAFDWSLTPLGPRDKWPVSVRAVVSTVLSSPMPMALWWGANYTLIYNDAYVPLLGRKHPDALGRSGRDVWADMWPKIGSLAEAVLQRGESVWREQDHFVLERDGRPEDAWFSWSLSPVPDEAGGVAGLLNIVHEETERTRAEEARLSAFSWRRLVEQSPLSTQIFAPDGTIRRVNRAWERLWGITPGDLPGYSILNDEQLARRGILPLILRAFAGEAVTIEPIPYTLDRGQYAGQPRWCGAFVYPVKDDAGRVEEVVLVHNDVTEQRVAEEALRESEDRLRAVFQQTEAGIAQVDLTGRFVLTNERYAQIVGRSREELLNLRMQDITHPDDLPRNLDRLHKAVAEGTPFIIEKRYIRPDGTEVWVSNSVSLLRGGDGSPSGVIAATVDITDRRRAEAALRESEAHARRIIDHTLAFVGVMTPDGTLTEANATALRAGGLRREDVVGRKFWDCYWWSYDPQVQDQLRDAVTRAAGGEVVRYDVVVRMAGGSRMPIDFMLSPVRDESGRVTHLIPSGVDIAERKRADEALRASEARFRQLADAMPQMVWVTQPDGHHEYYNKRWYEFTGVPEGSTDGEGWNGMFHPDDQDRAWSAWRHSLATGEPYEIEYRLRHRSGEYRWTLGRALPIRGAGGQITKWFGTCTDIDSIKRLQQEREHLLDSERGARAEAERVSRMKDEFLATLSHELRTPLNAILGWSQILANGSRNDEDLAEGLLTIERNARAQTQIIEDLLDMSRIISGKVRLDVQRVDLGDLVRLAIETARPSAEAKSIRLQAVLDPHAGPVSGDPNRLQQVFWNLLSNAVKFTPKGGRVQVLLERVNSHVEVSVIDTGEGITSAFLPHVFDRFRQADATTTRRHGGLGIGLSIVRQLVELHGGAVRVKSLGTGHGSTFTVALPLTVVHLEPESTQERRHPRTSSSSVSLPDNCAEIAGVKVLVVDDEPDARALVKRLLEDCRAEVVTVGSAREALERIRVERPQVLVSDVGMPGEDGYSLIKRVRELGAAAGGRVPAIALTAYARAEDRVKAITAGFDMHVAKPVEPAELVAMIASLASRGIR